MANKLLELLGLSKKIFFWTDILLVDLLIYMMVFDAIIILLTRTFKPSVENKYYDFHRKHGLLKITLFKLVVAYLLLLNLSTGIMWASSLLFGCLAIYGLYIINLLIALIRKNKRQQNGDEKEELKSEN